MPEKSIGGIRMPVRGAVRTASDGSLVVSTGGVSRGIVLGDFEAGDGWNLNADGLFNYQNTDQIHALYSGPTPLAWQRSSSMPNFNPIDPAFSIAGGSAVIGLYNYMNDAGVPYGGIFFDQAARQVKIRAAVVTDTVLPWKDVKGEGRPQDGATVGAEWHSTVYGKPRDGDLLNRFQDYSDVSGGPPVDADNTGKAFAEAVLNKTAGNIVINRGADLVMRAASGNTSRISFQPSEDPNTHAYIEGDGHAGGTGYLNLNPDRSGRANLHLGYDIKRWKNLYGFASDTLHLQAGTTTLALTGSGAILSSRKPLTFGTDGFLHAAAGVLHWNGLRILREGDAEPAGHTHPYLSTSHIAPSGADLVLHTNTLRPTTPQAANLGSPTHYWHKVFANEYMLRDRSFARFEMFDDLELIDRMRPLRDESGYLVMGPEGYAVGDPAHIPHCITNLHDLPDQIETMCGTRLALWELDAIREGSLSPAEGMMNGKPVAIDADFIEGCIHIDLMRASELSFGAIRQIIGRLRELETRLASMEDSP